jgi:hypothetical protein
MMASAHRGLNMFGRTSRRLKSGQRYGWMDGRFALGDGGLDLLQAIAEERSLTTAAHRIGWSYKHAWAYLRHAEHVLQICADADALRKRPHSRNGADQAGHVGHARVNTSPRPCSCCRASCLERSRSLKCAPQRGAAEAHDRNQQFFGSVGPRPRLGLESRRIIAAR